MKLDELKEKILNKHLVCSHVMKEKITEEVLKKLQIKSKFQLNDRLEGVSFLDKHIRRVMSCRLVEKSLGINLCDPDKILKCRSEFDLFNKKIIVTYNNNSGRISFPNIDFDYLIYVKGDDVYKRFSIKKIISKESFKKNKLIEKSSMVNKRLITIDSSLIEKSEI